MMTFEYNSYMKATGGLYANNHMACFDWMGVEVTNTIASASRGNTNMLKYWAITMENMTRHMKTGLGVLKARYSDDIPPKSRLSRYLNKTKETRPRHTRPADPCKPLQSHDIAAVDQKPAEGPRCNGG